MKPFSIFQLSETLHLRLTKWMSPESYGELSRIYEMRDQARMLNPQLILIEPLSMGEWVVRKTLAIVGLINMLWIFSALNSQGLKTWGLQAAAEALTRYVQGTGAAGMQSDVANAIAMVIGTEALIALVLPSWFFNWQNPVDKMVRVRLVERECRRMKASNQSVSVGQKA
jgi:hypothetical protein